MTPGQPCAGWGTTHTCPPWGQTKNKSNHSLLLHTPKSGREGGLSQTGPLPCMLQLHLAYQSYKSLTKHSQSQGTFNLPQQGIDLPNPTVGGLPSLSWCKVTLNPNSTAGGWRHKLLVTPGQPCAGWGTTHTCPPKQSRRHPSLQSAQGQRPSPKSCALSSDSCKHTCTAHISCSCT